MISMKIEKRIFNRKENSYESLWVHANIHFDNEVAFYGQPWINLIAFKDKPISCWDSYEIGIAIHDCDDYDVGVIYKSSKESFTNVFHELINWINDLEHGVIIFDNCIINMDDFFPDCGCERIPW